MDKKIGIGVIGCGTRMKYLLKLLLDKRKYKIIALYDINKKAIRDFKKLFNEKLKIHNSYRLLVEDKDIDWIFIGSWNSAHKEQIITAFNANKHVFCEKPIAISIKECKEIKKAYKKNLKFLIGYPFRFSPHYRKIKKIIEKEKIGKIVSMEFNETLPFEHGLAIMTDWRRFTKYSGGHILEKCCHYIDLANWLNESLVKKVASFGSLNFFKSENSYIFEKLKKEEKHRKSPFITEKDIVDNQVVIIEYYNGVHAVFHTNCSSSIPERRMYICGTEGAIRADVLTGKIEVKSILEEEKIEIFSETARESHGGGDKFLIKELIKMMETDYAQNTIDDAIKSAITAIAIDEAMKNQEVIDMESVWEKFGIS